MIWMIFHHFGIIFRDGTLTIPLQNVIIRRRTPHPDGDMMEILIFCFLTFLLVCTFILYYFSVHGSPGKCFAKCSKIGDFIDFHQKVIISGSF
jgi:hypothetical protein